MNPYKFIFLPKYFKYESAKAAIIIKKTVNFSKHAKVESEDLLITCTLTCVNNDILIT